MYLFLLQFTKHTNFTSLNEINFYQVLGFQPNFGKNDIHHSYLKLLNEIKTNPNASSVTKRRWKIMELALSTLSDPGSKAVYDNFGTEFLKWTNFQVVDYRTDEDLEKIQNTMGMIPQEIQNNGGIIIYPIQFDLIDFMKGTTKKVSVMERLSCNCSSNLSPKAFTSCQNKCKKNPPEKIITENVILPPGALPGQILFHSNIGDSPMERGSQNVIFVIYSKEPEGFTRNGANIISTLHVPLLSAINHDDIEFSNFDGEKITIKYDNIIKAPNKVLTIPGKGITKYFDPKKRGHLILKIVFDFPDIIPKISILKELLPDDPNEYE